MNNLPLDILKSDFNIKLTKTNGKTFYLYAYDNGETLEIYKENPFVKLNAHMIGIADIKEVIIFYCMKPPTFVNYKLIMLNDAYFENEESTQYKKGLKWNKFKKRRIDNDEDE